MRKTETEKIDRQGVRKIREKVEMERNIFSLPIFIYMSRSFIKTFLFYGTRYLSFNSFFFFKKLEVIFFSSYLWKLKIYTPLSYNLYKAIKKIIKNNWIKVHAESYYIFFNAERNSFFLNFPSTTGKM